MNRKMLAAVLVLAAMASGCGVKTGTVTTNYDRDGRVTSTVEDKAVGDPDTDYYRAVRGVAEQAAGVVVAKADAIKDSVKVEDTDSGEVRAWKSAFAAQAIASIPDTTAQNIQAVKKATTWKDVAKDGVEAAKDVAVVGVPTYGVVKGIKHLSKALGDRTEVSMTGDNNKYESAKTHINNDVSTYATEEGASPTVSATPAATTVSPVTSHTVHEAAELPEAPEGDEIKVPEAEAPAVTEPEAAAP